MDKVCRLMLVLALLVFTLAAVFVCVQFPIVGLLVLGGAAWKRGRPLHQLGTTFGTARFASLKNIYRSGLRQPSGGVIVGRASLAEQPSKWQAIRFLLSPRISSAEACRLFASAFWQRRDSGFIRIHDFVHLMTVAPAGAGKSVSVIIPNLLQYQGSCVIVDPKGELYHATAEHRRKVLGHKIIRHDPFGLAGSYASPSDTLNPLDFVRDNDDLVEEVRTIAESMVTRKGTEPDPHWNDWAVVIIASFMAFVCGCEADASRRHLGIVRDLVSSRDAFREATKKMKEVKAFGGIIARFGHIMSWLVDRELGSVMSSVQRHTNWMDSPTVAASLEKSTWDPRSLRSGKVTVYLMLPHDKLTTLAPLMRLWLSTILRVVTILRAEPNETFLRRTIVLGI
jgi:type IV secretion system protein VirD4